MTGEYFTENKPIGCSIYFKLSETSAEVIEKFISECFAKLSKNEGQLEFSIGLRALQYAQFETATDFDVVVTVKFQDFNMLNEFENTTLSNDFSWTTAGMISRIEKNYYYPYPSKDKTKLPGKKV